MPANAKSSALLIGVLCALLIGAGALLLGKNSEAAGPPGGVDVNVVNGPARPVPVAGQLGVAQTGDWVVGASQVGSWSVSVPGGIGIDPARNEVRFQKGTRRIAFFEVNLDEDEPARSFDVDLRGSTKIRMALTVNGTNRNVFLSLTSKVVGEDFGSALDFFETSSDPGDLKRMYDLPGEVLGMRISQEDGFHQVFVTIWGD